MVSQNGCVYMLREALQSLSTFVLPASLALSMDRSLFTPHPGLAATETRCARPAWEPSNQQRRRLTSSMSTLQRWGLHTASSLPLATSLRYGIGSFHFGTRL